MDDKSVPGTTSPESPAKSTQKLRFPKLAGNYVTKTMARKFKICFLKRLLLLNNCTYLMDKFVNDEAALFA